MSPPHLMFWNSSARAAWAVAKMMAAIPAIVFTTLLPVAVATAARRYIERRGDSVQLALAASPIS
jgi:hypothetical protein